MPRPIELGEKQFRRCKRLMERVLDYLDENELEELSPRICRILLKKVFSAARTELNRRARVRNRHQSSTARVRKFRRIHRHRSLTGNLTTFEEE